MIALVAAMDEAGLIGVGGHLPWHAPADLRRFRDITMNCAVVMGRKTYESIGRTLDGRTTLVLSRSTVIPDPYANQKRSLREALKATRQPVMVIGGAQVFVEALPLADRIYFTRIHHTFPVGDGAVYFPPWEGFVCVAAKTREADAENPWPMTFERWERRQ